MKAGIAEKLLNQNYRGKFVDQLFADSFFILSEKAIYFSHNDWETQAWTVNNELYYYDGNYYESNIHFGHFIDVDNFEAIVDTRAFSRATD